MTKRSQSKPCPALSSRRRRPTWQGTRSREALLLHLFAHPRQHVGRHLSAPGGRPARDTWAEAALGRSRTSCPPGSRRRRPTCFSSCSVICPARNFATSSSRSSSDVTNSGVTACAAWVQRVPQLRMRGEDFALQLGEHRRNQAVERRLDADVIENRRRVAERGGCRGRGGRGRRGRGGRSGGGRRRFGCGGRSRAEREDEAGGERRFRQWERHDVSLLWRKGVQSSAPSTSTPVGPAITAALAKPMKSPHSTTPGMSASARSSASGSAIAPNAQSRM